LQGISIYKGSDSTTAPAPAKKDSKDSKVPGATP
jgi:hypothetical protein